MKISLFVGDLCDVDADALCTSTNPRLSLAMGTGGSVLDRGGYQILRECEAIVEAEFQRSGRRSLPAGSAHVTSSGNLPSRIIVHCVASDESHRSSTEIIRDCVRNSLDLADKAECTSVAMPLFATGHARFNVDGALDAMAETLRDTATAVKHVLIVVKDPDRAENAIQRIRAVIPSEEIDVRNGRNRHDNTNDMWSGDWIEDDDR